MRIAVISSMVFKLPIVGYGGLEALAWLIAKGLAKKGHQVSLIAPDGSECDGVEIIPCGPAGMVNEQQAYGGFSEIKKKEGDKEVVVRPAHKGFWQHLVNMDVIVDHSWQAWSYTLKMEGVLKCPILKVMHAPVNTMISSPPPVDKPCIVCISQDQANHYEALFSPARAKVCYNGVDTDGLYKPMVIPRTNRFLFLARFSTVKSPDHAIEAAKKAEVPLDLVGDTSITGEPELYERCKAMADGKQIRIIGGVPRGQAVWWYSQAHGFLHLNSRFREPFGLAPIEAQGCGLPVIGWRFGSLPEIVRHGETGFLVDSMDAAVGAILMFDGKSEHAKRVMRENAIEHARTFSIERMVSRYAELAEEAVQSGGW